MRVSSLIILITLLCSIAAFIAQLLIDFTTVNIAASCLCLASAIVISAYLSRTDTLQTQPLSTFSIFGFAMTTQVGALLVQSIALTSLSENLKQPLVTFGTLFVYLIVAILTHTFFRINARNKVSQKSTISSLFEKIGLYDIPPTFTLWIMGWLGVLSMVLGRGGEVGSKVWDGFKFLTYAPFIIPIYFNLVGKAYANFSREMIFIVAWFFLIVLFGVLIGSRSTIFMGVINVFLIALLAGLRSDYILDGNKLSKLLFRAGLSLVVIIPLISPISDLSVALQLTRFKPGNRIANLIDVYQNKTEIEKFTHISGFKSYSAYDETYIQNSLFQRLVETKFHDNALYFSSKLSDKSKDALADKTIELLFGIFPQPVLDFFDVKVDKLTLKFSMGDYLANLASAVPLGGYRTGSIFAQGQALVGLFFIPIYALICFVLFYLMALLTKKSTKGLLLASPAMLLMWGYFISGITGESIHQVVVYIVRNFLQMIVIYLIVFWVCSVFASPIKFNRSFK